MNGIQINTEARVGNDPELREVSGTQVCNLSLGVTERKQNKQTQQWEDGTTTWLRAAVWGSMAANVAVSVTKGQLVLVTGILSERKYTTNEGAERTQLELRVDAIGPSLRFASASVVPNDRNGRGPVQQQPQQQYNPNAPAQAPWQQAPAQPQGPPPNSYQQQAPFRGQSAPQGQPQPNQQWATPAYNTEEAPF